MLRITTLKQEIIPAVRKTLPLKETVLSDITTLAMKRASTSSFDSLMVFQSRHQE